MGYYMSQRIASFTIPNANVSAALKAIRGKRPARGDTLEKAMLERGWEIQMDPKTGDVTGIQFTGEKYHEDEKLFGALAPYVEAGSDIVMVGSDDEIWRWYFDGKKLVQQQAAILFEPEVVIAVRGGIAEVESCPAGIRVTIHDMDADRR